MDTLRAIIYLKLSAIRSTMAYSNELQKVKTNLKSHLKPDHEDKRVTLWRLSEGTFVPLLIVGPVLWLHQKLVTTSHTES